MSGWIIRYLQRRWRGPALAIELPHRHFTVGQGETRTTVRFRKTGLLPRFLVSPSLAFGEGYMRGDIEVAGNLLEVLQGYYQSDILPRWLIRIILWLMPLRSRTPEQRSVRNAQHHYDLGNDFFRLWLDPTFTYSCAYFREPTVSLAQAQQDKLDLVLQKLQLEPGQTMLEVGCGWGSLLARAVDQHGVRVTGITPAAEQVRHITHHYAEPIAAGRLQVQQREWRQITGTYDRLVSVAMLEQVGRAQYPAFFRMWRDRLKPNGVSLLHTIGRMGAYPPNAWIQRYIFPGGYLPTLSELTDHAARAGLTILHVENLRSHYAATLEHWSRNFAAVREQVVSTYGEEFARMWWLYLQGSLAGFRWGGLQLWQIVLSNQPQPPLTYRWHLPD